GPNEESGGFLKSGKKPKTPVQPATNAPGLSRRIAGSLKPIQDIHWFANVLADTSYDASRLPRLEAIRPAENTAFSRFGLPGYLSTPTSVSLGRPKDGAGTTGS
ncbi:MAG: hypothetical protein FWD57_03390, partial [Polyangiaceae bacterium]|nr:hypothetical protein [Polyangiaceae bacterium]